MMRLGRASAIVALVLSVSVASVATAQARIISSPMQT
jgi:hypothetical protein